MAIMCTLPNMQTQDLEELLQPRKKQRKKTQAETIEIIVPATIFS
jgi:hypothetical protein